MRVRDHETGPHDEPAALVHESLVAAVAQHLDRARPRRSGRRPGPAPRREGGTGSARFRREPENTSGKPSSESRREASPSSEGGGGRVESSVRTIVESRTPRATWGRARRRGSTPGTRSRRAAPRPRARNRPSHRRGAAACRGSSAGPTAPTSQPAMFPIAPATSTAPSANATAADGESASLTASGARVTPAATPITNPTMPNTCTTAPRRYPRYREPPAARRTSRPATSCPGIVPRDDRRRWEVASMGELDGRAALVTGGTTGLGRAIAERVPARGSPRWCSPGATRSSGDVAEAALATVGRRAVRARRCRRPGAGRGARWTRPSAPSAASTCSSTTPASGVAGLAARHPARGLRPRDGRERARGASATPRRASPTSRPEAAA